MTQMCVQRGGCGAGEGSPVATVSASFFFQFIVCATLSVTRTVTVTHKLHILRYCIVGGVDAPAGGLVLLEVPVVRRTSGCASWSNLRVP